MNNTLRQHFEANTSLPQDIIDEVVAMFNNEAIALIDGLSELKPEIRDIVLNSLREYHAAIDTNKVEFNNVAKVGRTSDGANDAIYPLKA